MNKSSSKNFQPEPMLNSGQKADKFAGTPCYLAIRMLCAANLRLKIFVMENLENISTKELEKELAKRADKRTVYCSSCNKWTVYMGCSRSWREEPHCYGCRKPVENCICSRI